MSNSRFSIRFTGHLRDFIGTFEFLPFIRGLEEDRILRYTFKTQLDIKHNWILGCPGEI